MSTYNNCFGGEKKNINTFRLKKASYQELWTWEQVHVYLTFTVSGATGGVKKEPDNKEKHVRLDSVKGDSHTRNSPTNPMSYSVPNLPASMDNLLETFAAVARRNAGNNMLRSANAVSLARLLPPNSSSKFFR